MLESYSKKYTYSYSFRISVVFLTEAVWFVCMSCSFISSCKSIICMICPMKKIIIDSSTLILILNKKKKSTQILILCQIPVNTCPEERKLRKKKMIDVHTVKKEKKEKKKKQRFFVVNICLQLSNLFVSKCPILVYVVLYLVNWRIQLYSSKSKNLTYMKLVSYLNSTKVIEVSTVLIFYSFSPKNSINLLLHSYSPHNSTNHFQFMRAIHSTNNYKEQHLQISICSLSLIR